MNPKIAIQNTRLSNNEEATAFEEYFIPEASKYIIYPEPMAFPKRPPIKSAAAFPLVFIVSSAGI